MPHASGGNPSDKRVGGRPGAIVLECPGAAAGEMEKGMDVIVPGTPVAGWGFIG